MDKFVQQPISAPSVINEVSKLKNQDQMWAAAGPKSDESLAEVSESILLSSNSHKISLSILVLATITEPKLGR